MPVSPKDDDAFLSRWSRRKREETQTVETPEPAPDSLDDMTDEEALAELDLPEPEAMTPDDDFSAFMQARVPERLRRRALRVLWRSNPVLANLDELVDYGEDFTDSATVIENMQTVYEVGKGAAEKWKRHLAALAAEDETKTPDSEPEEAPVIEVAKRPEKDESPLEMAGEPGQPLSHLDDEPQDARSRPPAEPELALATPPRPMRFSFE